MNSRHDNFIILSEQRMTRIFQIANLISNLATPARYSYTIDEIEELFDDFCNKGRKIQELFNKSDYQPLEESLTFSFSSIPMPNNERNVRFRDLAALRLNNIYKNLALISNLRNRKNYTYSQEEIDELFTAYFEKANEIKQVFIYNLEELVPEFRYKQTTAATIQPKE